MLFVNIFLIVLSVLALAKAVKEWKEVYVILEPYFAREDVLDDVVEEEVVQPRYDVEGYKRRMAVLRQSADEDGLFDYQEEEPVSDFTGIEVAEE